MVDIRKKYALDPNLVENGAEFYFGEGAELSLLIRHGSSNAVKQVRKSLTNREQHLINSANFEKEAVRKVYARLLVAAIAGIPEDSETWEWGKKKLTKPEDFRIVFEDMEAIPFTVEVMQNMSSGDAFGKSDFEEDSKNS